VPVVVHCQFFTVFVVGPYFIAESSSQFCMWTKSDLRCISQQIWLIMVPID